MAYEAVGGVEAARRIRAGERLDIALLASDSIEALARDGFVDPASVRTFAISRTAVAVRAGAIYPPKSDEASIKQMVLAARKIGISRNS